MLNSHEYHRVCDLDYQFGLPMWLTSLVWLFGLSISVPVTWPDVSPVLDGK